jgi:plasmid stabilization system protein ParE
MSFSYTLHPEADKEYAGAYAWYEDQSQGLGEKFIDAVKQKLAAIAAKPELFGSKSKGFRETIVSRAFPYSIVYKIAIEQKAIYIVSIYHSKRNPKKKYRK